MDIQLTTRTITFSYKAAFCGEYPHLIVEVPQRERCGCGAIHTLDYRYTLMPNQLDIDDVTTQDIRQAVSNMLEDWREWFTDDERAQLLADVEPPTEVVIPIPVKQTVEV